MIWSGGRRGWAGRPLSVDIEEVVPMGVLSFRAGGCGRVSSGAMTSVVPFVTGRTCGDGGMERPRRGVRLVELLREPRMGGRRRGTGADIVEGREEERLGLLLDARIYGWKGVCCCCCCCLFFWMPAVNSGLVVDRVE